MNITQITSAVDAGIPVRWKTDACPVEKVDGSLVIRNGQLLVGLTLPDGSLVDASRQFYVPETLGQEMDGQDAVGCINCERLSLVTLGSDVCPDCHADGCLVWAVEHYGKQAAV